MYNVIIDVGDAVNIPEIRDPSDNGHEGTAADICAVVDAISGYAAEPVRDAIKNYLTAIESNKRYRIGSLFILSKLFEFLKHCCFQNRCGLQRLSEHFHRRLLLTNNLLHVPAVSINLPQQDLLLCQNRLSISGLSGLLVGSEKRRTDELPKSQMDSEIIWNALSILSPMTISGEMEEFEDF